MKLPQSFIDELLSRTDIIDIVEPRITLKKTGRANYSGLCPFHQEKTPSFSVSQTKQFYYCFGCKANGNAIGFLMAYEKLTFLEAVETLAAKAGILLPEAAHFKEEEKKPTFLLMDRSASFYQSQLALSQQAKEYLNKRGLSLEVIERFKIGYAPPGWHNLTSALGSSNETKQQLIEMGMLIQKNAENSYDRFRSRIMFPIRNRRGQTIAFGGRSLDEELPKYLNSPETNFFHKSRELYGLYEALQATKQVKKVIIVEGYLDVIALHQYGFTETVATLGTAISIHHIQNLLRLTDSLLFCFDGDIAGKAAAWRALEIALPLMNTGISINFLFLPNGEDPDSFVRKYGELAFKEQINEAVSLVDFFFEKLSLDTEIETLSGKTRLVYRAQKYLQKLPKGVFHELMQEKLANLVGLSSEKINEILNPAITQPKKQSATKINSRALAPPIRLAISLLIQSPPLLDKVKIPSNLRSLTQPGIQLLNKIIQVINDNSQQTTGSLLEYWEESEEKHLLSELASQDLLIPIEAWQDELQGTLHRIVETEREQQIQFLLTKGKKEGLNDEEKLQLKQLLAIKK